MPVSTGSAGGLPGMNLKAWVVMTSAGAVVKSLNVSGVVRNAQGLYTVSFTAPMSSANLVARYTPGPSGGPVAWTMTTAATGSAQVNVTLGGTNWDVGGLWEFYE